MGLILSWLGEPSKGEREQFAAEDQADQKIKDIDVEVLGIKIPGNPDPSPANGPAMREKICRRLKARGACGKDSIALNEIASSILAIGPYTNVQNDADGGVFDLQHPDSQELERKRLKRVLRDELNKWNAKYRNA
jgi:hypothetical protein